MFAFPLGKCLEMRVLGFMADAYLTCHRGLQCVPDHQAAPRGCRISPTMQAGLVLVCLIFVILNTSF